MQIDVIYTSRARFNQGDFPLHAASDFTYDGFSIKRFHKNDSKSLLAWDTRRKAKTQQAAEEPSVESPSGESTASAEEAGRYLLKNYKWSEQKKKQYAGLCPYGVSEESPRPNNASAAGSSSASPSKGKPVSLASLVGGSGKN